MKDLRYLPQKAAVYVAGLCLMAFGVAFSVNSGLGVSPVNSLPYVISVILGRDMGTCVTAVFGFYILVQFLLLRRKFHPVQLTQLLFSAIFGYFVDFAKWVLGDWAIPGYGGSLVMLFVSIFLVALGVCLYMGTGLVNMPMEGMTKAVRDTLLPRVHFAEVKVAMDCTAVAIGVILSLVFLGRLDGIREGTVICAVLVGKVMKPLQKILGPWLERICFGRADAAEGSASANDGKLKAGEEEKHEHAEYTDNEPGSDAGHDEPQRDFIWGNTDAVDG